MTPPASRRGLDLWLALTAAALGGYIWWRIEHDRSNLATGLMFLAAAGLALAVVLRLLVRLARKPALLAPVTLMATTLAVGLMTIDLGLRYVVRTRLTYGESNGAPNYRSIYRYDNPSWYHTYGRNRTFREVKTEFTHERPTNALGLTEQGLPESAPRDPGEYRVLALGDSYTEGVGAAYDESWVRVLERQVPTVDGRRVRAYNAGMSGSDLLLELAMFRDKFADFHPDLVLVALNNSDIADVMTRGGAERFRENGSIRGDRGPWWDWLYGINFLTRHVVHDLLGKSWLLLNPAEHEAAQAVARVELRKALDAIQALATSRGARFAVALNPHQYEVKAGEYESGFKPLAAELVAADPARVIDLLAAYKASGALTPENSAEYYWTLDFHHNAKGYALMGETIAKTLVDRQLLTGAPSQ